MKRPGRRYRRQMTGTQVTHNDGANAMKRRRKAAYATAKGCPGGWKKAIRRIIIAAKKAGTVWPSL